MTTILYFFWDGFGTSVAATILGAWFNPIATHGNADRIATHGNADRIKTHGNQERVAT